MSSIILFFMFYIILFILYFFFFYLLGLKKKSILKSMQVQFLKVRFNLTNKDLNPKKIGLIISFIDPFIISLTGTIVSLPKWNYVFEIILGFVLLMALIYSIYELLGRLIKRKVDKK